MPRYIAFLRGINVGGHRVKMDHLRGLFEEIGFTDVSTFIASGNVIFTAKSKDVEGLRKKIESHLGQELGYEVATLIRTPAELEVMAARDPSAFEAEVGPTSSLYVILLGEPAHEELRIKFADLNSEMDEFLFAGSEIYWLIQGKISESPLFGAGLGKAIRGLKCTTRNVTTIRKLVAKLGANGN